MKNVRAGLRMLSDDEFLAGIAIAGAKAHSFCCLSIGTTKVMPCYKTKSRASERRTSINSPAFRSDCKRRLPRLVFVVVKNVRAGLRMFSDDEFLAGIAIAGAKAHSFCCRSIGTTKVMPCYKAKTLRALHSARLKVVPCCKANLLCYSCTTSSHALLQSKIASRPSLGQAKAVTLLQIESDCAPCALTLSGIAIAGAKAQLLLQTLRHD